MIKPFCRPHNAERLFSPTTDGILASPANDNPTGHYSHAITDPMPDQRKHRPQVRNDNSYSQAAQARRGVCGLTGQGPPTM